MFLTIALVSAAAWIVLCGIFLGLMPDAKEREAREAAAVAVPTERPLPEPIDLLVYRLERHIRLEEAAAHNYVDEPSARNLHARTVSAASN